eukprot:GHVR01046563.1.p1 GENE.GHVR01046563.1~~GHVR01046563.1.p1  ORF type:complete len:493 (+),score=25.58 GHVR01046563.1:52-1530(+)
MTRLLCQIILASLFSVFRCQLYEFNHDTLPANATTAQILDRFFIYVKGDSPANDDIEATVTFDGMKYEHEDPSTNPVALVEVMLVPIDEMSEIFKTGKFCCTKSDVGELEGCSKPNVFIKRSENSIVHEVQHALPHRERIVVSNAGVYALVISNCGSTEQGVTLSGRMSIKNPYGLLPGDKYPKMVLFFWMSVVYTGITLVWCVLNAIYLRETTVIQACISAIILMGLIESVFWHFIFFHWNVDGEEPLILPALAVFLGVCKCGAAYTVILLASLGWGVTKASLDPHTSAKIRCIFVLYVVTTTARELVMHFAPDRGFAFVLMFIIPASAVNTALFYWIFVSLFDLTQRLKEKGQTGKLRLFRMLTALVAVAISVAALLIVALVLFMKRPLNERWRYIWLFTDGGYQILYCVVLIGIALLFSPSKHSQMYAFRPLPRGMEFEENDAVVIGRSVRSSWQDDNIHKLPKVAIWAEELSLDDVDSFPPEKVSNKV